MGSKFAALDSDTINGAFPDMSDDAILSAVPVGGQIISAFDAGLSSVAGSLDSDYVKEAMKNMRWDDTRSFKPEKVQKMVVAIVNATVKAQKTKQLDQILAQMQQLSTYSHKMLRGLEDNSNAISSMEASIKQTPPHKPQVVQRGTLGPELVELALSAGHLLSNMCFPIEKDGVKKAVKFKDVDRLARSDNFMVSLLTEWPIDTLEDLKASYKSLAAYPAYK